MAQTGFIITAVDRTSETLDRINKRLDAMNAPMVRLNKQWSVFKQNSGLSTVAEGLQGMSARGLDAFRSISRIATPLAAITSAASLAGMTALVDKWADFGTQLGFTSSRLNMSAAQLYNLEGAGRLAGVGAGAMENGLKTLNQTLFDGLVGKNPEAVAALNVLGVSLSKDGVHARSAAEALPEIADALAKIHDPTVRAYVAQTLFGGATEALLPLLAKGSAGLAEYQKRAAVFGGWTAEGVDAANKMRGSFAELGLATEGLGNSLAQTLAPTITPLVHDFATWLATSPEVKRMLADIGMEAHELADWLRSVDWERVGRGALDALHTAKDLIDAFGGVKGILIDIVEFMALTWAIRFVGSLITVGKGIYQLIWTLAELRGASAAAAAATEAIGVSAGVAAAEVETASVGMIASLTRVAGMFGVLIGLGMAAKGLTTSADDFAGTNQDRTREVGEQKGPVDNSLSSGLTHRWNQVKSLWGGAPTHIDTHLESLKKNYEYYKQKNAEGSFWHSVPESVLREYEKEIKEEEEKQAAAGGSAAAAAPAAPSEPAPITARPASDKATADKAAADKASQGQRTAFAGLADMITIQSAKMVQINGAAGVKLDGVSPPDQPAGQGAGGQASATPLPSLPAGGVAGLTGPVPKDIASAPEALTPAVPHQYASGAEAAEGIWKAAKGLFTGQAQQQASTPTPLAPDSLIDMRGRPGLNRPLRNNNPLDLAYVKGQQGLDPNMPSDGRFGRYTSMEAGVASAARQLWRYQDKYHLGTLREVMNRWAPASDNNRPDWEAGFVGKAAGVGPDDRVNLHDPHILAAVERAMAQVETGKSMAPEIFDRGVALANGAPVQPAAPVAPVQPPAAAAAPSGKATLQVSFDNAPPGMRTAAESYGDLFDGPVRVDHGMPGFAAP